MTDPLVSKFIEMADREKSVEAKLAIAMEALESIVEPPEFPIEGNEAALALRMNLIAHKAIQTIKGIP